ncbi:MAG TPA: electron transfer flavoprotein subunit alpha/FixB family protein [Desulfobacteraceae bacterium]|nr:electron transfer flavoprotein subunit alpha/FixB family protein [Desulfobacteraceae bacterium]
MRNIGVLLEMEDNRIKNINQGLLTAVQGADNRVMAFTAGECDKNHAEELLSSHGASDLIELYGDSQTLSQNPDLLARGLCQAAEAYELDALLGLATLTGRDVFARTAALKGVFLASDLLSIDISAGKGVKSHFSGKVMATLALKENFILCTLRPNAVAPVEKKTTTAFSSFTVPGNAQPKIRVRTVKKEGSKKMDLTEAPVVITGGRPIGAAENYQMLEQCAALLNGAVGASRAAVDAGFAPPSMQVGQTGKTVSPNIYIACGVSGAVQHFAGMKTSKIIIAINNDKDAPIFEKCDYGIVGDMFDIVPALTGVLKARPPAER